MMTETKSVVVTGASTGIGWGAVKVLVGKGFRVFGSVRKVSDAERLQTEFGPAFTPLLMDVTDAAAVQAAAAQVSAVLGRQRLSGLVNNAGIVVPGPLLHLSAEELRRQFEVNVVAVLEVTKAFAPLLGADKDREGASGRIVNISSVSGKMGVPFVGAYVASKHALEGMSDCLRQELQLHGIDVIVIGPGAVITAIWDKAAAEDYSRFDGTGYGPAIAKFSAYFMAEGRKGLSAETLGESIYHALTVAKPKTRYAVVPQPIRNWILPRLLPKRMLDRIIGKQIGLIG
jgi:NAD(P)-dependent dehydrogenase (short-subunit alcohol dehydrogenase family)